MEWVGTLCETVSRAHPWVDNTISTPSLSLRAMIWTFFLQTIPVAQSPGLWRAGQTARASDCGRIVEICFRQRYTDPIFPSQLRSTYQTCTVETVGLCWYRPPSEESLSNRTSWGEEDLDDRDICRWVVLRSNAAVSYVCLALDTWSTKYALTQFLESKAVKHMVGSQACVRAVSHRIIHSSRRSLTQRTSRNKDKRK